MVYNKRMSQLSWYNPTQIHFGSGKLATYYGVGAFVGIDASIGMLRVAQQRLPGVSLVVADAESLPFGKESFEN